MKFRVLLGAVVAGLVLLGSGGADARDCDRQADADDAVIAALELPDSAPGVPEHPAAPARTVENAPENVGPDNEDVPLVKQLQPGLGSIAEPTRGLKTRLAAAPVPARPPVPPPEPAEAISNLAAQIAPIGAASSGSVISPETIVAMASVLCADLFISEVSNGVSSLQGRTFVRRGQVDATPDALTPPGPVLSAGLGRGNFVQSDWYAGPASRCAGMRRDQANWGVI